MSREEGEKEKKENKENKEKGRREKKKVGEKHKKSKATFEVQYLQSNRLDQQLVKMNKKTVKV